MGAHAKPNREQTPTCVDCALDGCADGSGRYPAFCVTAGLSDEKRQAVVGLYDDAAAMADMRAASEASNRANAEHLCRIEETMDFAARRGYRRIGIAACSGLLAEARVAAQIFRVHGFEVYGYACKVAALPRATFNVAESCCDYGTVSCNPLYQAQLLNEARTDFNVVIGLCVGHDTVFLQHSDAPCTVLVVKDRALANNPVAALYAAQGATWYNRMLKPDDSFSPDGVRDARGCDCC